MDAQGSARSWGWNALAQVTGRPGGSYPTPGNYLDRVMEAHPGGYHTLAISPEGSLRGLGWTALAQLGPRYGDVTNPLLVSAGGVHSLVVDGDRRLWASGWNHFGQLGTGNNATPSVPVRVSAVSNVTGISAGGFHSVAIQTPA